MKANRSPTNFCFKQDMIYKYNSCFFRKYGDAYNIQTVRPIGDIWLRTSM